MAANLVSLGMCGLVAGCPAVLPIGRAIQHADFFEEGQHFQKGFARGQRAPGAPALGGEIVTREWTPWRMEADLKGCFDPV